MVLSSTILEIASRVTLLGTAKDCSPVFCFESFARKGRGLFHFGNSQRLRIGTEIVARRPSRLIQRGRMKRAPWKTSKEPVIKFVPIRSRNSRSACGHPPPQLRRGRFLGRSRLRRRAFCCRGLRFPLRCAAPAKQG